VTVPNSRVKRPARPAAYFLVAVSVYIGVSLLQWYLRMFVRADRAALDDFQKGALLVLGAGLVCMAGRLALRVDRDGILVATIVAGGAAYVAYLSIPVAGLLWIPGLIASDLPRNDFIRGMIVESTLGSWFAMGVAALAAITSVAVARVLRRMRRLA
jgi:hypothetical protein